MKKTNALRQLDRAKIAYSTQPYTYDPENLDVTHIAKENDLLVSEIYKTLVVVADNNDVLVALVPGDQHLDLKLLAKCSGHKRVQLAPIKDLQKLTGYIRGGCSPIGMKKQFPVFIHLNAQNLERLYLNAGVRGLLVRLALTDLLEITAAKWLK